MVQQQIVTPAKAGIQGQAMHSAILDSRFRGNDGEWEAVQQ